jgi:glycosyltransferase involved in cell wall biosynthesis
VKSYASLYSLSREDIKSKFFIPIQPKACARRGGGDDVTGSDVAGQRHAKIAVITRTRDRPLFLRRALDSVRTQTLVHELIWVLVNDGGEPGVVDKAVDDARAYGLKAIAVHTKGCHGMEAAANSGIRSVTSDYIAIHDDDDSWDDRFLERVIGLLDSDSTLSSAITHAWEVKERIEDGVIKMRVKRPFTWSPPHVYVVDLFFTNMFPPISHVFRRAVFDRVGPFDENFPVLGDWEFNIRVALNGEIGVIPQRLAFYHIREGSKLEDPNSNSVNKREAHKKQDAVFRNAMLRKTLIQQREMIGLMLSMPRMSRLQYLSNRGTFKDLLYSLFHRIMDSIYRF